MTDRPWPGPDALAAADDMAPVAALLRVLLEAVPGPTESEREAAGERRSALLLADALLRDRDLLARFPDRPAQVAILGPTQVGKSTVVNLLCGADAATVSPLAGFTVHACAFALAPRDTALGWLQGALKGYTRMAPQALRRDELACYGLAVLPAPPAAGPGWRDTVIWDTPDFDSVRSEHYSRAVLEVVALADLLVLVLSKEKYSDQAVWQMVRLLAPLGRPMLVCVNKLGGESEAAVLASLRQRLSEFHPTAEDVAVVVLPQRPGGSPQRDLADDAATGRLRLALAGQLGRCERAARSIGTRAYLRAGWPQWVAPLRETLAARASWRAAGSAAVEGALRRYRESFLDHDERFDSFRRALVELLRMLEIPAFAHSVGRLRQLLTWPARQLAAAWGARGNAAAVSAIGNEELMLRDLLDELLTGLAREVLRNAGTGTAGDAYWRALDVRIEAEREALQRRFEAAVQDHVAAFGAEIEASARRLLQTLEGNPALLNALRAARASADLGAVLLAIKTGGLGVNDLIVAPALLSLTSMLTEGALGGYMRQEAGRLRGRQLDAVRARVFEGCVLPALRDLGEGLQAPGLQLADAALLARAEAALAGDGE